jgi:hypothetical protein
LQYLLKMTKRHLVLLLLLLSLASHALAQQVNDSTFDVSVAKPFFTKRKPQILFDEAHRDFHTSLGNYLPFANLIKNDGCAVTPNKNPFNKSLLKQHDVLIIVNALGADENGSAPAFTEKECDEVARWVKKGGSLLLIADHYPFGSAAKKLSERFGVSMTEGGVSDSVYVVPTSKEYIMHLIFSNANGLLGNSHPIIQGMEPNSTVESVFTFFGQALTVPSNATVLLKLSPTSQDYKASVKVEATEKGNRRTTNYIDPVSANGKAQGLAFEFGKGKVVILGEAAMLTAQTINGRKFGMNVPGSSNKQFALNIVRWLVEE